MRIVIITGEESGDVLGASLVDALKESSINKFELYGIGGSLLLKRGIHNFHHINEISVMGIIEVIPKVRKINKIIPFIKKNFSGRKILICREMTKFYEEYLRSEVDDLELFKCVLKGELTIVISEINNYKKIQQILSESDKRLISKMINKLSIKEISDLINQNNKISKKIIYDYCLKIKKEK